MIFVEPRIEQHFTLQMGREFVVIILYIMENHAQYFFFFNVFAHLVDEEIEDLD